MSPLMTHDEVYVVLRKIAKSDYWQTIYSQSKETSGLNLFKNTANFTHFQIYFINQVSFYSSIYFDIAMGEVRELVLDNEIYEDAYYYYRHEKRMSKFNRAKSTGAQITQESDKKQEVVNQNQWVFTKRKNK